jgi:signal transduction histidine kinase
MPLLRLCGVVLSLWVLAPGHAWADELRVGSKLSGVALGRVATLLVDADGKLGIADVSQPALQERFEAMAADAPSFGFATGTFWLRLAVRNDAGAVQPWLLEVAYPHLDAVSVFVPTGDGTFVEKASGDRYLFAQRDLEYRNFVFELLQPAYSQQTYYVRVKTTGTVSLPLRAWTLRELFHHQNVETPSLWLLYGLLLVMAAYNLCLYAFVREIEHLLYVAYVLSMGLLWFALNGHAFQYVFPSNPWLANHLIPMALALLLFWINLFLRITLEYSRYTPKLARIARGNDFVGAALVVLSLLLPYAVMIRATVAFAVWIALICPLTLYKVAQFGSRSAKLFLMAWASMIVGAMLYLAHTVGLLPSNALTRWGMQLGAGFETVLVSVALADKINTLRSDLKVLNDKLTERVSDLKLALSRAEQATRAKTEFLATMSHELRTPLNVIINIPQAMAETFQVTEIAGCRACAAQFEMEPGDRVDEYAVCPECAAVATLAKGSLTRFAGEPEEAMKHLGIVERAGKHLLQMVNGILDHSKMEAGRLELRLERVELGRLVREAVETVNASMPRDGVRIEHQGLGSDTTITADPLRVKQVLINLLGNAVKFSEAKKRVTVDIERAGAAYLCHVRDHGIGIAPEDLERVFLSFEQVHQGDTRKYGGTGLGLSISRALIDLHGGEMWVQSVIGEGSIFSFRLPIDGPAAKKAHAASAGEASTIHDERLSA